MNRIVKFIFCLITCAYLMLSSTDALAQAQSRMMEWLSKDLGTKNFIASGLNQPFSPSHISALELIEITVDGQAVQIGQPFSANDNWIGKLTFKLKNISQKPILAVTLGLSLPQTQPEMGGYGFSFGYGKELGATFQGEKREAIQPDEVVELKFTEMQYNHFLDALAKPGLIAGCNKILVGNATVYFEDGTYWVGTALPGLAKSTR
jgi:hypothetical protein